jgi:GAF domain-containing protein
MSVSNPEKKQPSSQDALADRDEPGPTRELHTINTDNIRGGRDEIARLVAAEPDYKALFDRMMEVTKGFVDFDWANLFIFSPKREYSRTISQYGPQVEYQTRWFRTEPEYADWMDHAETWMSDLKEDIRNGPAPQMLERADVKIAIDAGTRALVALPVREGGEIKGGLCLLSKQRGIYGAETRGTMEGLMLDQALLAVFHAAERADRLFVSDLIKKIADSKDLRDLARTAVTDLAHYYAFDNTMIFKVNVLRERFELLAQEPGFEGIPQKPESYTQQLNEGLLGLTYGRGEHIILNDAGGSKDEARCYFRGAPTKVQSGSEMQSKLCIPIRLFDRILWILKVEDRRKGAFLPIELETLQRIIQQMQVMLDRMFQRDILAQVLDMLPDAVVILLQNGIIVRSNKDANRMFEREEARGEDIGRFFDDPDAKARFATERTWPSMTTIKGEHGKKTPVLVSKFTLPSEYDHVVVVLRDITKLQWKTDVERLKAALAETAGQLRVPISLLASFVQQIKQRVADEKLQDLTRKAMRQLGRVELTYDRVLASYDAQSLPLAQRVPLDVKSAIEHILGDLPRLEREAVSLTADTPAVANADPYRVLFALNSMLAYLLRARTNAERIVVRVRQGSDAVEVAMTGAVQPTLPRGELAAVIESTRTQLALGEDALRRMAEECGGSFERRQQQNGRERLSLRLASAH